jgi:predicted lipoprotein with Yx(FWY)xxD motif
MQPRSVPSIVTALLVLAILATGSVLASTAVAGPSGPTVVAHAAKASTTISTRKTKLGTVLVGPNGRTLYIWVADTRNHSKCAGACARVWPPLLAKGSLRARGGVNPKLLSLTSRKGGRQVTYNGWPLYYYIGDARPGQTTGQASRDFGANWWVIGINGGVPS